MGECCNGFGSLASSPLAKIPRGFGACFAWQLRLLENTLAGVTRGITIPPGTGVWADYTWAEFKREEARIWWGGGRSG